MTVKKRIPSVLVRLSIILAVFAVSAVVFRLSASAYNPYTFFVDTYSTSDGDNWDYSVGAVFEWDGTVYIISKDLDSNSAYGFTYNGENYDMLSCNSPSGIDDGLKWFTPANDTPIVPGIVSAFGSTEMDQALSMLYFGTDGYVNAGNIDIYDYQKTGNVYQVTDGTMEDVDALMPMLIIGTDAVGNLSCIVGYAPDSGEAILFELPTPVSNNDIEWSLDDGVLKIRGTGDMNVLYNEADGMPWSESTSDIEQVIIEDGITSICEEAFASCYNLTDVRIPDSVTAIGDSAFYCCFDLEEVTIPDSVRSIGNDAFSGCDSLKKITIPDGVISIGRYAFFSCDDLTEVTLPDSIQTIGLNAFTYSFDLTDIYYEGSVSDWNDIDIIGTNDELDEIDIHYNS